MAAKFAKFVEWATDSKYIPLGSHCSLCNKKLGFFRTGFWSINAGSLADGALCEKCKARVEQLLATKREWMKASVLQKSSWNLFNTKNMHKIPLQTAKEMFAAKEAVDQECLAAFGSGKTSLFRICDIQFAKSPTLQVLGKGGKYRFIPIMPKTVEHLRRYMELFHPGKTEYAHEYLFYTERRGIRAPMSDDNVRKLLRSYADSARSSCPSMPNNLHPHHFRHSRAMHLYQHGMELALVSQWLGHANLETTLIYAHADTEMKRRAIEKASSDICTVGTDATMPDSFDDDTLKRLYGLR